MSVKLSLYLAEGMVKLRLPADHRVKLVLYLTEDEVEHRNQLTIAVKSRLHFCNWKNVQRVVIADSGHWSHGPVRVVMFCIVGECWVTISKSECRILVHVVEEGAYQPLL